MKKKFILFGIAFLTSIAFILLLFVASGLQETAKGEASGQEESSEGGVLERFLSLTVVRPFEDFAQDSFFTWRKYLREQFRTQKSYEMGGTESRIVIVYIDKDSIDALREKGYGDFPWPRKVHATFLRKLMKLGVEAVGFDLLFLKRGEGDEELEKVAREYGNVTFACKWDIQEVTRKVRKGVYKHPLKVVGVLEPVFSHSPGQVGFVDFPLEERIKRRGYPLREIGGRPFVSFALNLFRQIRRISPEDVREREGKVVAGPFAFPTDDQSFLVINFRNHGEFATVPYSYILDLDEKDETTLRDMRKEFKGKIILVGGDAEGMPWKFGGDLFESPLGPMNGVEIHAHTLATYLSGNPLAPAPLWLKWFLFFLPSVVVPLMINIRRGSLRILLFVAFVALLALVSFFFFFKWNMLSWFVTPAVNATANLVTISAYTMSAIEKEKARIKKMFSGYLSPRVVDLLVGEEMRQRVQEGLAGKKETVTVFYSDIRGFTTLSENLMPEEVVHILNDYFDPMVKIVHKYDGYLDKFIGDCIMAVFSAPFPRPDDARRGVLAALEMQEKLAELREKLEEEGREPLYVGMGLNTGRVILGNIGSSEKMDYTVIGDAVNVASRLYAIAKPDQILISEFTYKEVEDLVEARPLGPIQVKGRKEPVVVYEVVGRMVCRSPAAS